MGDVMENCGFCITSTLHDAYSFGKSLQHRGREAAGIAAIGEDRIDVVKWEGPINKFDIEDLHKLFPGHHYHTYMIHVRYATRGRKDKILEDAHPHVIGGQIENKRDHVLILDCEMAAVHNGQVDSVYFKDLKDKLKTGCDTEALLYFFKEKGETEILKKIPRAYTLAIADKKKNRIVVLRDRTGVKPGCLFWKDGRYGIASEDIATKKNGGEFIEDLQPGAVYYLYPNNKQPKPIKTVEPSLAYCFFEWNYIAHVDSIINGLSVRRVRETLGETAAEEFDFRNADLVTYVPRCPEVAARSYARKLELNFEPVFYKMRGERSFMGSTLDDRMASIQKNLYLLPGVKEKLRDSVIVVIDDSFIRGNVLERIAELFGSVDAAEVHVISYTPPVGIIGKEGILRGCSCGVDMPPDDCFLIRGEGRNKTEEEINREYEDKIKVHYLSLEGMLRAYEKLGMPKENLDTYCIGGDFLF